MKGITLRKKESKSTSLCGIDHSHIIYPQWCGSPWKKDFQLGHGTLR
jgi:hypothetical protein